MLEVNAVTALVSKPFQDICKTPLGFSFPGVSFSQGGACPDGTALTLGFEV